jgi:excisionase family DNA binding protein
MCAAAKRAKLPNFSRRLSVDGAATFVNKTGPTVRSWAAQGLLPYFMQGSRMFFLESDLQEFLDDRKAPTIGKIGVVGLAEKLTCGKRTAYGMVRSGLIRAERVRGKLLIDPADVDKYLENTYRVARRA